MNTLWTPETIHQILKRVADESDPSGARIVLPLPPPYWEGKILSPDFGHPPVLPSNHCRVQGPQETASQK